MRYDEFLCNVMPLNVTLYFPFYRSRESTGYNGRKEKNKRERKFFRVTGPFLSFMLATLTWPVVIGIAPSRAPVCLMTPCPSIVSELGHPIPPQWAARCPSVLISSCVGSRQHSDPVFITVGDVSPLE